MQIPVSSFANSFVDDVPPALLGMLDDAHRQLGVRFEPYIISKDYTFTDRDQIDSLQVNATAAAISVTLSTPAGNRRRRVIKTDSSANAVTVVGTINGAANYLLNKQYEFVTVEATATAWLIVSRGTLTPSFNSVAFPETQVASADPNTLDDYEEGTWTPSVGGSATYTQQTGRYTKIGRLVFIQATLIINVLGTGSVSTVSGLPFSAGDNANAVISQWTNLATAVTALAGIFVTTTIQLTCTTAAQAAHTAGATLLGNGTSMVITGVYSV